MGDVSRKYNLKNPGVKRLMREAAELREPTEQYYAQPLEENLFEWHFTVRGPSDTDFEEGIYHGRIILPPEYPMKPPSIILLTPNGRFELGKKICLSMSAHHPETWQPSWSIRTVLLALIGFMPSKGAGAIGSLDYTSTERKALALKSQTWTCGACQIDHTNCVLEKSKESKKNEEMNEAKELASQISFKGEPDKTNTSTSQSAEPTTVANINQNNQNIPSKFQQEFLQFQQFIQNQQAYASSQSYSAMSQKNDPQSLGTTNTCINTSTASIANVTNSFTSQTNTATSTNIQPMVSPNSSQTNIRHRNVISSNSSVESVQRNANQVHLNTGRSFLDTVSLWLMWVVAAILVVLIIRRLALEKTNLTHG